MHSVFLAVDVPTCLRRANLQLLKRGPYYHPHPVCCSRHRGAAARRGERRIQDVRRAELLYCCCVGAGRGVTATSYSLQKHGPSAAVYLRLCIRVLPATVPPYQALSFLATRLPLYLPLFYLQILPCRA